MKNNKPDGQREAERLNIERLVEDTFRHIEALNGLAEREPELLVPIARKQIVWPAFRRATPRWNEATGSSELPRNQSRIPA